jgi:hypothetical protein
VGPAAAGILKPQIVQRKKNVVSHRITDGHGSATLSGLLERRKERRVADEAEISRKAENSLIRAQRKVAKDAEAAALLEKWRRCEAVCVCNEGGDPDYTCPMILYMICPYCDELKKKRCAKASCRQAAAAAEAANGNGVDDEDADFDDFR